MAYFCPVFYIAMSKLNTDEGENVSEFPDGTEQ
jgi:hypothetical protein